MQGMTIECAIKKVLNNFCVGDFVSKLKLTQAVCQLRGVATLDASISRILRYMRKSSTIDYEEVDNGVFEIIAKNWDKEKKTAWDALNWAIARI